jgi:ribosome maturation factor RimP
MFSIASGDVEFLGIEYMFGGVGNMPTFLFLIDPWYDRANMAGYAIVEKVKGLITPIILAEQLELVDVEFKREGHVHYLRIFIDKPGGVTIEDCQKISQECEVILDVENIIHTQYILEVSSPGLDRPLRTKEEYKRFLKRLVKIKTFCAIKGQKKFLGYLQEITDGTATTPSLVKILSLDGEEIQIPYEMIASARLEVEF